MIFNVYGLADRVSLRFELDKEFYYDVEWIPDPGDGTSPVSRIEQTGNAHNFNNKVRVATLIALKILNKPAFRGSIYDVDQETMRLVCDILMPTALLKKYKELMGSYYNLKSADLAKVFDVSEFLVNKKLEFIGIQPI